MGRRDRSTLAIGAGGQSRKQAVADAERQGRRDGDQNEQRSSGEHGTGELIEPIRRPDDTLDVPVVASREEPKGTGARRCHPEQAHLRECQPPAT